MRIDCNISWHFECWDGVKCNSVKMPRYNILVVLMAPEWKLLWNIESTSWKHEHVQQSWLTAWSRGTSLWLTSSINVNVSTTGKEGSERFSQKEPNFTPCCCNLWLENSHQPAAMLKGIIYLQDCFQPCTLPLLMGPIFRTEFIPFKLHFGVLGYC